MKHYARIETDLVAEIVALPDDLPITEAFPGTLAFVECDPEQVAVGDTYQDEQFGPPPPTVVTLDDVRAQARAALYESDRTVLRCFEADVSVPQEWKDYRAALRGVVNLTEGPPPVLPTRPAYPAGT